MNLVFSIEDFLEISLRGIFFILFLGLVNSLEVLLMLSLNKNLMILFLEVLNELISNKTWVNY